MHRSVQYKNGEVAMVLPERYLLRMKHLLGDEYKALEKYYNQGSMSRGVRLNTLKCSLEKLKSALPFSLRQAPFASEMFYAADTDGIGRLPAFHAGMFYAQEPSAAAPVALMQPQPGENVLDLCAAPGGKATQIAQRLCGDGLLWANEKVASRAKVLRSNIERMGISNAVVSSMHPERLCTMLSGFFDKVLVDAPCSGEGMFLKEEAAVAAWSEEAVRTCAVRQRSILNSAAMALREGGELIYSTCTFSLEENEEVVRSFLAEHPDFELVPLKADYGRPAFDMIAIRIFPMDGGAGHFIAKLRRRSPNRYKGKMQREKTDKSLRAMADALIDEVAKQRKEQHLLQLGSQLFLAPPRLPELKGLQLLSVGVMLGSIKGKRIEPAHALFMAARPEELRTTLSFSSKAPQLSAFLHGLEIDTKEHGYVAVACDDVITGFGKGSEGRLKNKYPKGLRIN